MDKTIRHIINTFATGEEINKHTALECAKKIEEYLHQEKSRVTADWIKRSARIASKIEEEKDKEIQELRKIRMLYFELLKTTAVAHMEKFTKAFEIVKDFKSMYEMERVCAKIMALSEDHIEQIITNQTTEQ